MLTNLRFLIWAYFLLLVFEGALRKWVVPMLDQPLLLIRDPLVVWIYYIALSRRYSFQNPFNSANMVLAVLTVLTSLVFGLGNPLITIYGLRTDFLQIPLIFLIPQILDRHDLISMGKWIMYIGIPMAPLVAYQFHAPPDSWVNHGAMATHYGTVRPSGIFSFGTSLAYFYALGMAFVLYGFLHKGTYPYWLMAASVFSTLMVAALSGSRGTFLGIAIVVAVFVLCTVARGKGVLNLIIGAAVIGVAGIVLSQTSIGGEGLSQLQQRVSDAGAVEGGGAGFLTRFVGGIIGPLDQIDKIPIFGYGLGLGTNAGLAFYSMSHDSSDLIWPEVEWARLIFESGPVLGILMCAFRVSLVCAVGWQAFKAYGRDNVLPALIFSASALLILNGQWGVPNTLGFGIFDAGLILAACHEPDDYDEEEEGDVEHDNSDYGDESDHPHAADHLR